MDKVRKLWKTYAIIVCLAVVLLILYFLKNAHFCPKGAIWTGSQCNGTGVIVPTPYLYIDSNSPVIKSDDYVKGEILVTFNNETTYRNAKQFLQDNDLDIQDTNSYWLSTNFKPTDATVLKTIDIFTIEVPIGDEDKVISELKKFPIIRSVGKNQIMQVNQ